MKKCIVSFSSHGRENYNQKLLGLIKSCKEAGWDGDYYLRSYDGYVDEYLGVKIKLGSYPVTERYGLCNNHSEIPYGFKPHMIQEAREQGYEQIIWCDSTIRMEKYPQFLIDYANDLGIAAHDNLGFPLYGWLNDYAQERLKISDENLKIVQQIMACQITFDFTNPKCVEIFDLWLSASRDGVSFQNYGSLRDGFKATRHDQAYLSGLLYNYEVPLLPYGKLVYPPHHESGEYGNDFYFVNGK